MPKGDKYIKLKDFLIRSNQPIVKLLFSDIERIIENKLPASAYNDNALPWWSNDHTHSQAVSWLDAGYETDCVSDTYQEKYIVFIKVN
ncbi:MAG: hypothetical protein K2J59_07585 [Eubacterium sp.]|nr:hypothetical protein [Eubacterium sp.]